MLASMSSLANAHGDQGQQSAVTTRDKPVVRGRAMPRGTS
jgi:hypothetical protein